MNNMRQILAQIYSSTWVSKKTDQQVIAIYKRLQMKGVINV